MEREVRGSSGNGPGTGGWIFSDSLRNDPDQGGCPSRPEGGKAVRAPTCDAGLERAAESGAVHDVERHHRNKTTETRIRQMEISPGATTA